MLSFFPRGVLDEILNLIESVSEGFSSYSHSDVKSDVKTLAFRNDVTYHHDKHRMTFVEDCYAT